MAQMFANIEREYETNGELVHEQDLLTQDLLHKIELEPLNAVQLTKAVTMLKECRQTRRYHKDITEEYEPIIQFMQSGENKKAIKALERVLGEARKRRSYHERRQYIPRVLNDDK